MNLSAIPLYTDKFKQLSMNSRNEVAKFEPGPNFENTIHKIKDNHLRIISSSAMNLSSITSFDENIEQLSTNRKIEVTKFEPEPTFEKTICEIKSNQLKSITYLDMNVSAITSNKTSKLF